MAIYTFVVLHESEDEWADQVEARIRSVCAQVLLREDLLERLDDVGAAQGSPDAYAVIVYLASVSGCASETIAGELDVAQREAYTVVPIVRAGAEIATVMPDGIRRLNALEWGVESPALALLLLRAFGLIEMERRLFLSYRRAETAALALQLRDALSRRGYDVFLDRFSVPPGADFQRRIDIELSDKAFVLLVESSSAVHSPWVQHEVTYALSHHIAVLSLTMPDVGPPGVFEAVDEALRHRLKVGDFENDAVEPDGVLTGTSLATVLDAVEVASARQLRRKRSQLLGTMRDWLSQAGFDWQAVTDWGGVASRPDSAPKAMMVTARPPSARALRETDILRRQADCPTATLVHDTIDQDAESTELLDWIMSDRPLTTVALAGMPNTLGI